MILLNKFMHICQRFKIMDREKTYKFSSKEERDYDKFPIKHVIIGRRIWFDYNGIFIINIDNHMMYDRMMLFLDDNEFVEAARYRGEAIYPNNVMLPDGNGYSIRFNINSYLTWNRHKKHYLDRKKLLEWI